MASRTIAQSTRANADVSVTADIVDPKGKASTAPATASPHAADIAPGPRQTKAALLRGMVAAHGGASLTALTGATGWQAHTVRAALTGLRKAGLAITRRREGADTIYSTDGAVALPASAPLVMPEETTAAGGSEVGITDTETGAAGLAPAAGEEA